MEHVVFNPAPLTLDWDRLIGFLLVAGLAFVALWGLIMAGLRTVAAQRWRALAWTTIAIVLGVMVMVGWHSRIPPRLRSERVLMRRGFDVDDAESQAELLPPPEKADAAPLPAELRDGKSLPPQAVNSTESRAERLPRAEPVAAQQEKAELDASQPDKPKPDWVGMHPERIDNLYRTTASAGPYSTDEECYRHINREVGAVVCKYVDELLGIGDPYADPEPWASQQVVTSRLEQLNISPRYIRGDLWTDQYIEFVDSSVDRIAAGSTFGKMRILHVLLEFDGKVQDDLRERWQKSQLTARLTLVGITWVSLLALLGIAFAYLSIDTATKGSYSGRLRLAAGLVTILLVGMIVAVIRRS